VKLHPLAQALVEEQTEKEMSGPLMARMLGVSGAAWSLVSRGIRQPGPKIVAGTLLAFPKINVARLLKEAAKEV
jgi:hypothetical protein